MKLLTLAASSLAALSTLGACNGSDDGSKGGGSDSDASAGGESQGTGGDPHHGEGGASGGQSSAGGMMHGGGGMTHGGGGTQGGTMDGGAMMDGGEMMDGGMHGPSAPTMESVMPMLGGLHVTWKNPAAGCDEIELLRKEEGGSYAVAYTLAGAATSVHDTQVTNPGTYCYEARCVEGSAKSPESNEKCGTP